MSSKRTICIKLEAAMVERIDALAATMSASRTWTIARLLDASMNANPAGAVPSAGQPGDRRSRESSAVADFEGNHK